MKKADVDAIVDYSLIDRDQGVRHAVGFLDTSVTTDKTPFIVLEDDSRPGEGVFFRLALSHAKVWNPKDRTSCPKGYIDPEAVETHVARVLGRFTRFQKLKVDTRVMPWAKQLVQNLQRGGFGSARIEGYEGNQMEDSAMYLELLDLIVQKRLRIPDDPELRAELVSLRKVALPRGGIKVVDAGAGKDGRNRKVGGIHRDVAMAIAGAALVAADLKLAAPAELDSIAQLDRELAAMSEPSPLGGLVRGKL